MITLIAVASISGDLPKKLDAGLDLIWINSLVTKLAGRQTNCACPPRCRASRNRPGQDRAGSSEAGSLAERALMSGRPRRGATLATRQTDANDAYTEIVL